MTGRASEVCHRDLGARQWCQDPLGYAQGRCPFSRGGNAFRQIDGRRIGQEPKSGKGAVRGLHRHAVSTVLTDLAKRQGSYGQLPRNGMAFQRADAETAKALGRKGCSPSGGARRGLVDDKCGITGRRQGHLGQREGPGQHQYPCAYRPVPDHVVPPVGRLFFGSRSKPVLCPTPVVLFRRANERIQFFL